LQKERTRLVWHANHSVTFVPKMNDALGAGLPSEFWIDHELSVEIDVAW